MLLFLLNLYYKLIPQKYKAFANQKKGENIFL